MFPKLLSSDSASSVGSLESPLFQSSGSQDLRDGMGQAMALHVAETGLIPCTALRVVPGVNPEHKSETIIRALWGWGQPLPHPLRSSRSHFDNKTHMLGGPEGCCCSLYIQETREVGHCPPDIIMGLIIESGSEFQGEHGNMPVTLQRSPKRSP